MENCKKVKEHKYARNKTSNGKRFFTNFLKGPSNRKLKFLYDDLNAMSKEEIKYEISKVLDHFSDTALQELLAFLKDIDSKKRWNLYGSHID